MKYLFIILSIIGIASVATLFLIWPQEQTTPEDTIVTINGRPLSRQDILEYKEKVPYHGDSDDFISEIITKQLLIAEAQKQGIDKEPDFRRALKTFYEHSLMKILMERVDGEIEVTVTDKEVEKYLHSFGKTFTFYTLKTADDVAAEVIKEKGVKYVSLFGDLGESLQQVLAGLTPGQTAIHFVTGNEKFAVMLESIAGTTVKNDTFDEEHIRRLLLQKKKENQVNEWIEALRRKASITYQDRQD